MELPDEVVNKIIMFMSHPCADMIKKEVAKRKRSYLSAFCIRAKFSWEREVLENKISLIERARIERERL